jgi:hypothetical protein
MCRRDVASKGNCHFQVIKGYRQTTTAKRTSAPKPGFVDRYISAAQTPSAQTCDIPVGLILVSLRSHVDFATIPAVLAKMPFDVLSVVFERRLLRGRTAANRNQKNQTAQEKSDSADDQRYAQGIHNKIPKYQLSGQPTPAQRAG